MARNSVAMLKAKRTFCLNFLSKFKTLYTPESYILYIIFLSELLLSSFYEVDSKDAEYAYTGQATVSEISGNKILGYIVQLRNSIVHCDSASIIQLIKLISECDYDDDLIGDIDLDIIRAITKLHYVDWSFFEHYIRCLAT